MLQITLKVLALTVGFSKFYLFCLYFPGTSGFSRLKSVKTEKLNFELEKFIELIPNEPKSMVCHH